MPQDRDPQDDDLELEDEPATPDDDDSPDSEDEVVDTDSDPKDSDEPESKITEKRLKDTQAALTKANQANAELRKKVSEVDELKGKLDLLLQQQREKQAPTEEVNEFGFLDDEKETATLLDDPKNVASMLKKTLSGLAGILQKRDQHIIDQVRSMVDSTASDDGRAVRAKISELRKDDDYKVFSDEQLTVLAKKQIAAASKKGAKDKFRGGPGSSNGYRTGRVEDVDDAVEAEADRLFKMLYPDEDKQWSKK